MSDLAFHALREYVPGDDLRHVHWRSSAKAGELLVRQYHETRRGHVTILLDPARSSYPRLRDFELAVSVAASIALRAVRDDFDTYLRCGPHLARSRSAAAMTDIACRFALEAEDDYLPHSADAADAVAGTGLVVQVTGRRPRPLRARRRRRPFDQGRRPARRPRGQRRRGAGGGPPRHAGAPVPDLSQPPRRSRRGAALTSRARQQRRSSSAPSSSLSGARPVDPRRHLLGPRLPRGRHDARPCSWSPWRCRCAGSTRAAGLLARAPCSLRAAGGARRTARPGPWACRPSTRWPGLGDDDHRTHDSSSAPCPRSRPSGTVLLRAVRHRLPRHDAGRAGSPCDPATSRPRAPAGAGAGRDDPARRAGARLYVPRGVLVAAGPRRLGRPARPARDESPVGPRHARGLGGRRGRRDRRRRLGPGERARARRRPDRPRAARPGGATRALATADGRLGRPHRRHGQHGAVPCHRASRTDADSASGRSTSTTGGVGAGGGVTGAGRVRHLQAHRPGRAPLHPGPTVEVKVQIRPGYASDWLPDARASSPGSTSSSTDGRTQLDDIRYNQATSSAVVVGGVDAADDYTFNSVLTG